MQKTILILVVAWISAVTLSGCASSKAKVFGTDMPSMKTIHDEKFHNASAEIIEKPERALNDDTVNDVGEANQDFQWLPNPTLSMYVFKHLTSAGHPVPGYATFFRLYTRDHIAVPGEQAGWE